MKNNIRFAALSTLLLSAMLMSSCEVEFSPNAEYVETPVVYCVLDQDDDTTWARVERCFLEEGNIYNFGSQSQLYTYPQGTIKVNLLAYRNGSLADRRRRISQTRRDLAGARRSPVSG